MKKWGSYSFLLFPLFLLFFYSIAISLLKRKFHFFLFFHSFNFSPSFELFIFIFTRFLLRRSTIITKKRNMGQWHGGNSNNKRDVQPLPHWAGGQNYNSFIHYSKVKEVGGNDGEEDHVIWKITRADEMLITLSFLCTDFHLLKINIRITLSFIHICECVLHTYINLLNI